MAPKDSSPEPTAQTTPAKFARDLRFLAAALKLEAEEATRGQRDVNEALISVAGATIFLAYRQNLIDDIIDLKTVINPEILSALDKANLLTIRDEESSPGPMLVRDAAMTVQEFIEGVRAARQATEGNNPDTEPAANGGHMPLEYRWQEADGAAALLLSGVWTEIAFKYRDQLPDDIAGILLNNPYISDLFVNNSVGLRKSAFVCEFLAARIVRAEAGRSEGWLTISDAETLTGINKGTLSRGCEDQKIQTNGEAGLARRIAVASLVRYCRDRKKADADEEQTRFLGWECTNCEATCKMPEKCDKCGKCSFVPIRQKA